VRRLTATKPESLEFDRQGRGRPSAIRRVTLVCLIVVGGVWLYTFKAKMPDFEVYWRTGARAAHAEPLYRVTDGEYQFKYFPAHAVLAIPLGALPHPVARVVWFVVLLGALVAVLRLSVMTLPERRKPVGVLLAVLIVGLGKYYAIELAIGQINLLLVLIVISAMLALKAGREARAGWLVALAVMVKPYGLILVPWLIARGQTRSVVTVAAGMAVALLGLAVAVFLGRRGVPQPDGLEAGLLIALTPLLSPQGWDYILVVCTPAVVCLVNYIDRLPRALRPLSVIAIAAIGLTLFDLVGRTVYYALIRMSVVTLGVLVVIALLGVLRVRKVA
jgi:Glycosyltransferase family 87